MEGIAGGHQAQHDAQPHIVQIVRVEFAIVQPLSVCIPAVLHHIVAQPHQRGICHKLIIICGKHLGQLDGNIPGFQRAGNNFHKLALGVVGDFVLNGARKGCQHVHRFRIVELLHHHGSLVGGPPQSFGGFLIVVYCAEHTPVVLHLGAVGVGVFIEADHRVYTLGGGVQNALEQLCAGGLAFDVFKHLHGIVGICPGLVNRLDGAAAFLHLCDVLQDGAGFGVGKVQICLVVR